MNLSYIASSIVPVDPTLVLKEWNETHGGRLVYDPDSDWFIREN